MKPRRQTPPYLPTPSEPSTTSGSLGRRCSTGGRLPAFTWSASTGASLNLAAGGAGGSVGLTSAGFASVGLTSAGFCSAGACVAGAGVGGGVQAPTNRATITRAANKRYRLCFISALLDVIGGKRLGRFTPWANSNKNDRAVAASFLLFVFPAVNS